MNEMEACGCIWDGWELGSEWFGDLGFPLQDKFIKYPLIDVKNKLINKGSAEKEEGGGPFMLV